jgi:CYTH domain-containing protein
MDKTAKFLLYRLFLIEALPDPLSPLSRHLQILDRYISGTALRLRQIRDPHIRERTCLLQKRILSPDGIGLRLSEIHLDDHEYALLGEHAGFELRKNRYFHEFDQMPFAFDVFLGPLSGLKLAIIEFESIEKAKTASPPVFSVRELTRDQFFHGENLCQRTIEDVTREVQRLSDQTTAA